MSSIKLSPNASGTGEFTIAAPNSNTNRTLTLPDQTGTVLTNAGPFTANASASNGAVTIDASNNVQIGTTTNKTNSWTGGGTGLTIGAATAPTVAVWDTTDSSYVGSLTQVNADLYLTNTANGVMVFNTNNTERMRLDSSGFIYFGATTTSAPSLNYRTSSDGGFFTKNANTTGATTAYDFLINGTRVGAITTAGSNTTYSTSSDYRLKHDVQPMIGALARVAALKPVTYKWNIDDSNGEGFIAHELQEVCPSAVIGEKDAVDADGNIVPQGIDTSFLVATLTAALQELNAKVEAQAAEIAALKGAQ